MILVRTKDGVHELGEKLVEDLARWTPEQKADVRAQLLESFGISKVQLLAMPCGRTVQ